MKSKNERINAEAKNVRITEGEERNAYWRSLTPAQQLADLDARLGKDVGAKRQRAILTKKLDVAK